MYNRKCPKCQKEIVYQSLGGFNTAIKKQSKCRACISIETGFTNRFATKGKNCGQDNPFYGKTHTQETKDKINKNRDYSIYQTKEFREKQSKLSSGTNNKMYGKNVYDEWVKRYGKQEADRRDKIRKQKWSKASSGKNNPMYGKPTPRGSGNGWKGWYKSFFFRSLRELCYMIELDANNIKWSTGETINIEYIKPNGDIGTYKPDFIVGSTIIEIKPIRLHKTPSVIAKYNGLKKYCKNNNLSCKLIDQQINCDIIRVNIDNSNIRFYKDYLKRFEDYEKTNNS